MNFTPSDKEFQPAEKTEAAPTWQDYVVEEVDEEAAATLVGGAKKGSLVIERPVYS